MYKQDLALNNLQGLICHKTQPNQTIFSSFHLSYHIRSIYGHKKYNKERMFFVSHSIKF